MEIGGAGHRAASEHSTSGPTTRSVMTIAFEFALEAHLQESVASMARQYLRTIIASVQRLAIALSPHLNSNPPVLHPPLPTPEAHTLARWISHSYRLYLGMELSKSSVDMHESSLNLVWYNSDAIICCSLQELPVVTFSNQAGLDMLETTFVGVQDMYLEKIFDDQGKKLLCSQFPHIMQQGYGYMEGGVCASSMGRGVSYEKVVVWKVMKDEEDNNTTHCICFMFVNWSFL